MRYLIVAVLTALATVAYAKDDAPTPPPSQPGFVDSVKEFGRGIGRTVRDGAKGAKEGAKDAWRGTRKAAADTRVAIKSAVRRAGNAIRDTFKGKPEGQSAARDLPVSQAAKEKSRGETLSAVQAAGKRQSV
jgi:hypothetical protein